MCEKGPFGKRGGKRETRKITPLDEFRSRRPCVQQQQNHRQYKSDRDREREKWEVFTPPSHKASSSLGQPRAARKKSLFGVKIALFPPLLLPLSPLFPVPCR